MELFYINKYNLLLAIPIVFLLLGCESQYDKGYKKGYSEGRSYGYRQGYSSGKNDGYTQGKNDGYTEGNNIGYKNGKDDGYIDGTKYFVKGKYIPSLGLVILFLIFIGVSYFLFNYLKDPVKRKVERNIEITEREREIKRIKEAINIKKNEEKRINEIKAKELTMELFRKVEETMGDAKNTSSLNKFQNEIEIMIIKEYFDTTSKKYQEELDILEEIKDLPDELNSEKSNLVKLFTKNISPLPTDA